VPGRAALHRYRPYMSLTKRPGPLSTSPTPEVNYRIEGPAHRILFEPHPRRFRAELDGRTVLDTVGGRLLHESNILPRLYVPLDDFDASLMERTDHTTHCPFKGDASYWSVRAGDRVAENAIWAYEDPLPEASWLAGYASMYWHVADAWYEEDEQVFGHLRDPYHRVDVRRSSRHAVARANGEVVAETDSPVLVFETDFPVRLLPARGRPRRGADAQRAHDHLPLQGDRDVLVGDRRRRDARRRRLDLRRPDRASTRDRRPAVVPGRRHRRRARRRGDRRGRRVRALGLSRGRAAGP
jgi:uncharacterized protein (DUF427 family)